MTAPLSFSPIASASSAEEVEHLFSQTIHPSRVIRAQCASSTGVEMRGVSIGTTSVLSLNHCADYEVDSGEVDGQDSVIFGMGIGEPSSTSFDGKSVVLTDNAVIFSNTSRVRHTRSRNSGELLVKCPTDDLVARLQASLDRPVSKAIQFDRSTPLAMGIGAHAKSALFHVTSSLDADPCLLEHPLIASNFEDVLLGVLLSMPNNYTSELLQPAGKQSAPAVVTRAEEYMDAHAGSPITIADVLSHAGCSRKVLFDNFRKSRDYTPGEFLTNTRLKLAHERLRNPHPMDSVTTIAYDTGFSHMGRFSEIYRKRYGVKPSATLKRFSRG